MASSSHVKRRFRWPTHPSRPSPPPTRPKQTRPPFPETPCSVAGTRAGCLSSSTAAEPGRVFESDRKQTNVGKKIKTKKRKQRREQKTKKRQH